MRASYKLLIVFIGVAIFLGGIVFLKFPSYNINGFDKALEGILLFASISLGFYGACMSVIASIFNTKVVKEIMADKEDKTEFITVVSITLATGFLTVFLTIVYQVMLENKKIIEDYYFNLINSFWFGLVFLFASMNFLFIFVSFLIFFSNKSEDKVKKAYSLDLKQK